MCAKTRSRDLSYKQAYAVLLDVQLWNVRRMLRREGIRPDRVTARRLRDYAYALNTTVFVEGDEVVVSTPVLEGVQNQLRIGQNGCSRWHFDIHTA